MPEAELPRDHFVSRGYQQNFASAGKRVAVFNARYGRVVDLVRPIKSNFREQGFTAFLDAGVPNDAPHSSCSRHIGEWFRDEDVTAYANDAELIERFTASKGRPRATESYWICHGAPMTRWWPIR